MVKAVVQKRSEPMCRSFIHVAGGQVAVASHAQAVALGGALYASADDAQGRELDGITLGSCFHAYPVNNH